MDIFNSYSETKEALAEIQRQTFSMFEDNDVYNIIGLYDLKYLDYSEDKQDNTKLVVNLYNYADSVPAMVFSADRVKLLACSKDLIDIWHDAGCAIIEKANAAKLAKFMRDFQSESDKQLIGLLCSVHGLMEDKMDTEIAKIVAKQFTKTLKENKKIVVQAARVEL